VATFFGGFFSASFGFSSSGGGGGGGSTTGGGGGGGLISKLTSIGDAGRMRLTMPSAACRPAAKSP
jgi:hypothetical protein